MNGRGSMARLGVVALILLAGACTPPPRWPEVAPAARTASFIYGVADAATGTGYVASDPSGAGIDAIDLATGVRRWHTNGALRPLLVTPDGALVAQAAQGPESAVRLVLLDRFTGAPIVTSQPIAVPDWACPGPDQDWALPAQCTFVLGAWPRPDETLRVEWSSETSYWTPAGPPPRSDNHQAAGAATVDFRPGPERGRVSTLAAPASAPVDVQSLVPLPAGPSPPSCTDFAHTPAPNEATLATTCVGSYQFSVTWPKWIGKPSTATLTAWDARTGREAWHRDLWTVTIPEPPP